MIAHLRKRIYAEEFNDTIRAEHHNERLQHHHDAVNSMMTALMRTEGCLGLIRTPRNGELGMLMIREFRHMNASISQLVDVLRNMVYMLFARVLEVPHADISSRLGR